MKRRFSQHPSRGQVSLFLQLHKHLGVVDVASTVHYAALLCSRCSSYDNNPISEY